MDGKDFRKLIAGLEGALAYAKGRKIPGARAHRVKADRPLIAETRLKAGLTQELLTTLRRK
jgi:putative transcriptional regulator